MNDVQPYLNQWEPEFKARSTAAANGPVTKRSCQDILCLVFFLIVFLAFVGVGAWLIHVGWTTFNTSTTSTGTYLTNVLANKSAFFGLVFGMCLVALLVALIFVCCIKSWPRCTIWFTLIVTVLALIGLIVLNFLNQNIAIGVTLIVIFLVLIILFFCCWGRINSSVIVARVAGVYLRENWSIYCVAFFIVFLKILILAYLIAQIIGAATVYSAGQLSQVGYGLVSFFQGFWYVFFVIYFHYLTTFVVACAVAFWYFRLVNGNICTGFGWSFYHIGSFTYATVMIPLMKLVQLFTTSTHRLSLYSPCDFCSCCNHYCFRCCSICFEGLIRTLNHYSTIVSALTGDDYVSAARSANVLVWNNFGVFNIIDSITPFFFILGFLFTATITSIVGFLIARYATTFGSDSALVGVLILFFSMSLATIILTILTATVKSLFIFYSYEERLQTYGLRNAASLQVLSLNNIEGDYDGLEPRAVLRAAHNQFTQEGDPNRLFGQNIAYQQPIYSSRT